MLRDRAWRLAASGIPEGQILPRWLIAIRCVLYPLQSLRWMLDDASGYQWREDAWLIDGVKYSSRSLQALAQSDGQLYRVRRSGDTVTFQRIYGVRATEEQ